MQASDLYRGVTAEQQFFLDRLFRLISLQQHPIIGQVNEAGHTLVQRAIYAVYCDCLDVGASAEAQQLLALLPRAVALADVQHPR